jgi:S-adenosylmethionine:diacylglycerol 3-amino-3-carboxypropyl transferase
MSLYNPPFQSDIFYSVQNEDYRTEMAVLRRLEPYAPLRVLMIASAGENLLSLLTMETVGSIEAVDMIPAQLQLCELRQSAVEHLTRDEQLRLFGSDASTPGPAGQTVRLDLYDRLRPHLSESCRAFWDAHRKTDVAFGLHHVGRNDRIWHDVQKRLQAAGFDPIRRPPTVDEQASWEAIYSEVMTVDYIREVMNIAGETFAARIAGQAAILADYHAHALRRPQPEYNPYLTTVFDNCYATAAGESGLPLYLQGQGQAALKHLGMWERLRLHAGNMVEMMTPLAEETGGFHLISLSNITDWMSDEIFNGLVAKAHGCLQPGGALLARKATRGYSLAQVMQQHLRLDLAFNAELLRIERGPFWHDIAVGFRGS